LETLKTTASARPLTLALGVGIFLVAGLLFFWIKDFIFAPRGADAPAPVAATSAPAITAEPPAPATASPSLEAPAAPAIDPRTLYRDAMTGLNAAQTEGESAAAIEKLEQAALLGHPPAQLQLGELYKTGQGVNQDLSQARVWFRRAANGGNVLAMHRIGVMTARGEGGAPNTPEAVGWFEQAANHGLVDSQYNLGAIYHPNGNGPETGSVQDAGKAYYWYSLAAKNGDAQAEPLAAGVSADLNADQKKDIDDAVAAWEALPSDAEANTLAVSG
jgi:localization factor PodJL